MELKPANPPPSYHKTQHHALRKFAWSTPIMSESVEWSTGRASIYITQTRAKVGAGVSNVYVIEKKNKILEINVRRRRRRRKAEWDWAGVGSDRFSGK